MTPPRKKLVPFSFGRWKKKVKVLLKPMMKTKPERKRTWEDEEEWVRETQSNPLLHPGQLCLLRVGIGSPSPIVLTFPKARSTESKYKSTPKRTKKIPKPTSPTPIPVWGGGLRLELTAQVPP